MKTQSQKWLALFSVGILLLGLLLYYGHSFKQSARSSALPVKPLPLPVKPDAEKSELFPFEIDMAKAEHDPYFGPPVPFDPADKTMVAMRLWMLGFAKAMDNPKHPCNPLVTTNAKIVGMNIKPLRNGDMRYIMWVSDGKTICGMEAVHFENWSGVTLKGDFFQRLYLRDMANGFGYNSKTAADELIQPDKKLFWKEDIGEAAHDMVVDALGQSFLDNTLPQQYSGFSVADALNVGYLDGGYDHPLFTKNVVDANLMRADIPRIYPGNPANDKFSVYVQAEPSNSPLAFKVVYADAFNNGFDPSKKNGGMGQKSAVRLR
jgi:hypothetical protein